MTTTVVTVQPDTPFKEIAALLTDNKISAVPVVADDGSPLGVVSEADLIVKEQYEGGTEPVRLFAGPMRRRQWRKAVGLVAREVMTAPPVTIPAEASVPAAARRLAEEHVRRLLVVDRGGRLVGIVSRRDLLGLFLRTDEQIREDVAREVLARALWADPTSVRIDVADGVVTLTGQFERRSEAETAVRLTVAHPGVVGVVDQLTFDFDDIAAASATKGM